MKNLRRRRRAGKWPLKNNRVAPSFPSNMLENREYMRGQPGESGLRRYSVTFIILAVNAAVYVLQWMLSATRAGSSLDHYLGLSLDGLRHGYVWQLLTFQFLHGGLLHLLLNSLGIYAFGPMLEQTLGRGRFLRLYLLSGVIGGLVHVLGSLILPRYFGVIVDPLGIAHYVPVVGASAGVFGLIAAFATLWPRQELTVYLFFVFPVTVTARVLFGVSAGIGVLGVFLAGGNVAHGAHLGGMLTGFLFVRFMHKLPSLDFEVPLRWRFPLKPVGGKEERKARPASPGHTAKTQGPDEFISTEVDPILDKISAHGIQSLTERERKILAAAQKKMSHR
jgi:membrane associated rhomboid family serine protease